MAQTLTRLLVHVVFSTKHREPTILDSVRSPLYAYIGGICRGNDSPLLTIGGTPDHVHLMVSLSKNLALSDLVLAIKRDSSHWIKTRGIEFASFHWQDGYAGFTIGESGTDDLAAYIRDQAEHHRATSFQDELRAFLRKYKIEYDERYVWD